MNISLKQAIQNKMIEHKLNRKQLNKLENTLKEHSARPLNNPPSSRIKYWGIATALLVVSMSFILPQLRVVQTSTMVQLIAEEVVANHMNLKPLELKTNKLENIRSYFTKLSFKPINSSLVTDLSSTLIGGRYCSLQGITAAQLRLQKSDRATLNTLYQTEYRKEVFGPLPDIGLKQSPITVYAKGIRVDVWVEKGVLFAKTNTKAYEQE